ncbi:MAG: DUF6265 family protein [Planctomycetota bacterium]|jgi:hypothetical protein
MTIVSLRALFTLSVLGALVVASVVAAQAAPEEEGPAAAAPTIQDLAWIAGRWQGTFFGGEPMEEAWLPPLGNCMLGGFRTLTDGKASLYECLVIEAGEDGIVLRMRHFNAGLEPWASEADGPATFPLASMQPGKAVFEDPDRPFPQRQVYELIDEDHLQIRLEGTQQGQPHEVTFDFTRIRDAG